MLNAHVQQSTPGLPFQPAPCTAACRTPLESSRPRVSWEVEFLSLQGFVGGFGQKGLTYQRLGLGTPYPGLH